MRDEIIFESHPDFSCNSYAVYEYFVAKKVNERFKLTWLVDGTVQPKLKDDNVEFLNMYPKGLFQKIVFYVRCNRAKIVMASNRNVLPKYKGAKRQINIYLDHGSQLKSMRLPDKSRLRLSCDYLICQSEFFAPYCVAEYSLREDQIVCTGLPRNDQLFIHHSSLSKIMPDAADFNKIIIWVPTFRQNKRTSWVDCKHTYPMGLPVLNSLQNVDCLNDVLIRNRVLLLIKPHPAQRLDLIRKFNSSNIRFIYNEDMHEHNIQMNELLEQTDAMITDYSSIYYDYLLLHRPIGITLDDFDDYMQDKGFVFEDPLKILKGKYIYTLKDFCSFICDVSNNIDSEKESREKICGLVHTFEDGNSSQRLFDFIRSRINDF